MTLNGVMAVILRYSAALGPITYKKTHQASESGVSHFIALAGGTSILHRFRDIAVDRSKIAIFDRQTTDGRTMTYSEHELEFTFAKKWLKIRQYFLQRKSCTKNLVLAIYHL